jgi:hypothetical protein
MNWNYITSELTGNCQGMQLTAKYWKAQESAEDRSCGFSLFFL